MTTIDKNPAWKSLVEHNRKVVAKTHLRELMTDNKRISTLMAEHDGILLDSSRQNATPETLKLLLRLATAAKLPAKMRAMAAGKAINTTEHRAVQHIALRADKGDRIVVDGRNIVDDVHEVLTSIRRFAEKIRSGAATGATGKPLTDVVAIGIGGSYLGPEFVSEAFRTDPDCAAAAHGRRLRFLANVDPIDVARALEGLEPERTLVVVISKTFTTAETMLNAKTLRAWLGRSLGEKAVAKHMVAVSTNIEAVTAFGIDPKNVFGFWDWVGGRYSVCSAVGVLPLALQYGWKPVVEFLAGARDLDQHFLTAAPAKNLPVLLGLWGVWNSSFRGHATRALLPYCQALHKFAPHIQQVDMESNGKRVTLDGTVLPFQAGEIDFGEPGTNGQHSFYQLLHQGRVVPADFIGFTRSQQPQSLPGEEVPNHDELMANFFAQPDALAFGKTKAELKADKVPAELIPHKEFPGNRPSNVLLIQGACTPKRVGQLLSLYEHRTAVQGFIWGLNSFDQWGVELGKVLAKQVRNQLAVGHKQRQAPIVGFNPATTALLDRYMRG